MLVLKRLNPFRRLMNWYFSKNALPYWCILIIDNAIVFGSYLFMYLLFNKTERSFASFEMVG